MSVIYKNFVLWRWFKGAKGMVQKCQTQQFAFLTKRVCISFVSAGGTVQGLISDMLEKRAPVLAISLILAVGSLFGYSREYFST